MSITIHDYIDTAIEKRLTLIMPYIPARYTTLLNVPTMTPKPNTR